MKTFTRDKERSEVDLRVAQEIKNNQEQHYQTGQSLQNLSEELRALNLKYGQNLSKFGSDRKELLIEFENLKEWILKSLIEMTQRIGDAETKIFKVLDDFVSLKEEVAISYLAKKEFYETFIPEQENIDDLQKKMIQNKDYFNLAISILKAQYKVDIQEAKKELTPKLPEVDPIKKHLDERLAILKVDFDGLIREIDLLKKSVAYDQKKFENIYTLIERLKVKV